MVVLKILRWDAENKIPALPSAVTAIPVAAAEYCGPSLNPVKCHPTRSTPATSGGDFLRKYYSTGCRPITKVWRLPPVVFEK